MKIPVFVLTFLVLLASPVLAQATNFNGGFETTSDITVNGASTQYLTGSCQEFDKDYQRPDGWTFYTSQLTGFTTTTAVDNAYITDQATEGSNALLMYWTPPNNCELNITDPSLGILNTTTGHTVRIVSDPITVTTNNLRYSMDISIPDEFPIKCSGGLWDFCQEEYYGSTCQLTQSGSGEFVDDRNEAECEAGEDITQSIAGRHRVTIHYNATTSNGSQIIISGTDTGGYLTGVPSEHEYITKEVSLGQFLPEDVTQILIDIQVLEYSGTQHIPRGIVIDNIELETDEIFEPATSPAIDYIEDLTTLTTANVYITDIESNWASDPVDSSELDFTASRLFDGVAIGRVNIHDAACTSATVGTQAFSIQNVTMFYDDGTFTDTHDTAWGYENCCSPANNPDLNIFFGITNPEKVDKIRLVFDTPRTTCAGASAEEVNITLSADFNTIRQTYTDTLDGTVEDIIAVPYLYPFIIFNNQIDATTGNHTFNVYNLNFQPTTITEENVLFKHYNANGIAKNIHTQNFDVAPAIDVNGGNFTAAAWDYSDQFSNWINTSGLTVDDTDYFEVNGTSIMTTTTAYEFDSVLNITRPINVSAVFGADTDVVICEDYCGNLNGEFCFFPDAAGDRVCNGTVYFSAFESAYGGATTICSVTPLQSTQNDVCAVALAEAIEDEAGLVEADESILDVDTLLAGTGFEFLSFMATPTFILLSFFLVVSGYAEYKIRSTNGVVFLITLISGLTVGWYFGIFDPAIALLLGIIASGFLLFQVQKLTGISLTGGK